MPVRSNTSLVWRDRAAAGAPRPSMAAWPNPAGSGSPGTELVSRDPAAAGAPRPSMAGWPNPSGSGSARTGLVWRNPAAAGAPRPSMAAWPNPSGSGPARTELVWRDPAAGEKRAESVFEARMSSTPAWNSEPVVHSPQASATAAIASTAVPDVGRLVDEVVRRLERIGRDERLRRGL